MASVGIFLTSLLDAPSVDVNTAGARELETLPGIGPVQAAAIVEFREEYGPFLRLDDLLDVPGIGPATLEGMTPLITLGSIADVAADTLHWLPLVDSIAAPLLSIAILDVGEGDAVLLIAAGGRTALVDGGPDDDGPIMPAAVIRLAEMGIDSIDVALLTHPHEDHIGGLDDVVSAMDVDTLYDPGCAFPSPIYEDLLEAVERTGTAYALLDSGRVIRLSPSVEITVIACRSAGGDQRMNENSAVLEVSCGSFSILVPGDIEASTERRLAAFMEPVTAMVIPHHGSGTSAFLPFIRRLAPEIAVASAGRENPFGHPHSTVIAEYAALGATVLRTDTGGTIFIDTDGICVSSRCYLRGL